MRGGTAVLDQGLFSGSNFILNILLARWLSIEEFGAYAIALAALLVLSGFHNAVILEPMTVLATSNHADELREYVAGQFILHGLVTGALGTLTLCGAVVLGSLQLGDPTLPNAIAGVGLFLPLILLVWMVRRASYVMHRPRGALVAAILYAISLFAGALWLHSRPLMNEVAWWFGVMGAAGVVGSIGFFISGQVGPRPSWKKIWRTFSGEQWRLGRGITLATILYSIGTQVQVFVAASMLGLGITGQFRAVQNLVLPMSQILVAGSNLSMPSVSRAYGRQDYVAVRAIAFRAGAVLLLIGLGYEIALLFGAGTILWALYGTKFSHLASLVPFAGTAAVVAAASAGYSMVLRSLQRPEFYILEKGIVAVVGLTSAFYLVARWGVAGGVMSLVLVEISTLAIYLGLYRRWFTPRLSEAERRTP